MEEDARYSLTTSLSSLAKNKTSFRATLQHHPTSFSDVMAAEKLPTSCARPAKLLTIVQLNVRSESYNLP